MKGDRRQRHLKILELIETHAIGTQEELARALARDGVSSKLIPVAAALVAACGIGIAASAGVQSKYT